MGLADILFIVAILLIIGCVLYILHITVKIIQIIYRRTSLQYKTVIQGQGTVTKKRWNRPIWLQHTENNNFPLCALDEFHVYVTYNCERLCFDGKEFFDKVNVGDTVMVHLHCGYDKAGKIRHEYYSVDV